MTDPTVPTDEVQTTRQDQAGDTGEAAAPTETAVVGSVPLEEKRFGTLKQDRINRWSVTEA